MTEPLLLVQDLVAGYEPGVPIVRGTSLVARPGEIVVVLGPNGAGKSSFIKAIAGLVPVESGSVRLAGADITHTPAHRLAARGLSFVPQTENVFPGMSVEDNLRITAAVLPARTVARQVEAMFAMFPDLARQHRLPAGSLSGGQRQMLAVARALMASPKILMLDEPSAGLSPKLVEMVFERLAEVRRTGVTIVLVEQNVRAGLSLGDRAMILVEGCNRHEGTAADLWDDPAIAKLYLGGRHPEPAR